MLMRELEFMLTEGEERRLLHHLFAVGAWLHPDIHYDTPEVVRVDSYEEYRRYRQKTRQFFVLHQSYFVVPLEVDSFAKDGVVKFFIAQRNGGPAIQFMSTVEFEEKGLTKVNAGFVGYHKPFWNQETARNEQPPDALLVLFRSLTRLVKRHSTSVKIGVRHFWVGNEMRALMNRGERAHEICNVPPATN